MSAKDFVYFGIILCFLVLSYIIIHNTYVDFGNDPFLYSDINSSEKNSDTNFCIFLQMQMLRISVTDNNSQVTQIKL